jgi:hypothetical protein
MKQNMIIFAFLMYSCIASAMNPLCRTYAIDPRFPETYFLPGETITARNIRLATLAQLAKIETEIGTVKTYLDATAHPFKDSPDLFAPKGTSPKLARSPKEVCAELIAQAAENRALDAKK